MSVSRDSDHFNRSLACRAREHEDGLADGASGGPQPTRQRLVDDSHGSTAVALGERAPGDERNAEHAEKPAGHVEDIRGRRLLASLA
jgi:hypothetical protein